MLRRWLYAAFVILSCLSTEMRPADAASGGCVWSLPAAALAAPEPRPAATAEKPCHNGHDVVDFAWRLIGYGKATLQYLVGILLVLLGGVFLLLGYLIELVEALFC